MYRLLDKCTFSTIKCTSFSQGWVFPRWSPWSFIISVKISCFCWPQLHYNHYSKCHSVSVPQEGALISFYFRCTMVILCYSLKFHINAIGIMVRSLYHHHSAFCRETILNETAAVCGSLSVSPLCLRWMRGSQTLSGRGCVVAPPLETEGAETWGSEEKPVCWLLRVMRDSYQRRWKESWSKRTTEWSIWAGLSLWQSAKH